MAEKLTASDYAIKAYMESLVKEVEADQIVLKYTARKGLYPRWELTVVDEDLFIHVGKGHLPQEAYDNLVRYANA